MDDLESQRKKTHQRMAWVAMGMLCFITLLVVSVLVFSPERESISKALSGAGGILSTLLGVLVMVPVSYIGASTVEKVFKKE